MNRMHATPTNTPTIDTNEDVLLDDPEPTPDTTESQPAIVNPNPPPPPSPDPAPRLPREI